MYYHPNLIPLLLVVVLRNIQHQLKSSHTSPRSILWEYRMWVRGRWITIVGHCNDEISPSRPSPTKYMNFTGTRWFKDWGAFTATHLKASRIITTSSQSSAGGFYVYSSKAHTWDRRYSARIKTSNTYNIWAPVNPIIQGASCAG